MTLQRRQYEIIAGIINDLPQNTDGINDLRELVAKRFAEGLKGTNPAFKPDRFYQACVIGGKARKVRS